MNAATQRRATLNENIKSDARLLGIRTAQLTGRDIWDAAIDQNLRQGVTLTQRRIMDTVGKANAQPLADAQGQMRAEIQERKRLRLVHEASDPTSTVAQVIGSAVRFECDLDRCSKCAAVAYPDRDRMDDLVTALPF